MHKPFGGMAPFPLVTLETNASIPIAIRGAHSAALNDFGAPATPMAWHAMHDCLYFASTSNALADTEISRAAANPSTFFMALSPLPIYIWLIGPQNFCGIITKVLSLTT